MVSEKRIIYLRNQAEYHRLVRYAISKNSYNDLLLKQEYKCKICKKLFNIDVRNRSNTDYPCIDHDHTTGKVRGLLCRSCNGALGLTKDNICILQNMITYLNGVF